jgi:uncharacterized protein (DUF1330 family)
MILLKKRGSPQAGDALLSKMDARRLPDYRESVRYSHHSGRWIISGGSALALTDDGKAMTSHVVIPPHASTDQKVFACFAVAVKI